MVSSFALAVIFAIGPGTQAPAPQQPPVSAAQTKPDQPWPPPGVPRPGAEVSAPRLLKDARPKYTAAALDAGIQGVVLMEAVVGTEGTISDVRVKQSLDQKHGLDDEAVRAVKTWRFEPGQRDGKAVPVLVEIEMSFSLRKK